MSKSQIANATSSDVCFQSTPFGGPPFKNCTYSTQTMFFPFVWSNSARNSIFPGTTKIFSFEKHNRSSGNRVVLYPIPPKNWIFVDLQRSVYLLYFWHISHEVDVPRQGQIKISQLDNKTSLDLAISRIRTWGASSTTFFLELGEKYFNVVFELQQQNCQYLCCVTDRLMSIMLDIRQSVSSWRGETWNDSQGWKILKMKKNKSKQIKQNPNDLRLMVRETTSTRRPPGSSSSGSSRPARAPQDAVEEEQYYDQDNAGVTFLKIDFLANFLLSIILWWIICCATSFIVRVKERGLGSTQYSQQFWAYTIYYMPYTIHSTQSPLWSANSTHLY